MMIDKQTGEILFRAFACSVGPSTSRRKFLESSLGAGAKVLVQNEPWCSYILESIPLGVTKFLLILYFKGPVLKEVHLTIEGEESSSWADWSRENELRKKAEHDAWLISVLGQDPYRFPWGHISSVFDEKSGGSEIILRYSEKHSL